ncbi:MAG: hypothetical protein A2X86_13385 [Bdellovibrionales bacterium GWA2_49_15]|nr:MAG: hypothetical protein A2X86_13385 [Bdellovibrionales bacterium GWA2_49_15]HAZ13518.1 hypothetical protein [Bdellovibrionales bacterium]
MKRLFIYLVLLSCGLVVTSVCMGHPGNNHLMSGGAPYHVNAGDTKYKQPVHSDPAGFIDGGVAMDAPEGFHSPVQPFKGPIIPFNRYVTGVGDYDVAAPTHFAKSHIFGQEGHQCNPNEDHPCPGNLECVEENVDGEYLCPGRPNQVVLTETDEIQCGSGSGSSPKCGTGPQGNTCIADSRWRPSAKNFSTSSPWSDLGGGPAPWTAADGPHKLCYFEHDCILPTELSPRKMCKQDCMNTCTNERNPDGSLKHSHAWCDTHCNNHCNQTRVGMVGSDIAAVPAFSDKCTYEGPCLNPHIQARPSKTPQGQTISETYGCTDHYQCSSGLCLETDPGGGQPKVKTCVPFAKCRRPCTKLGEAPGPGDFCCLGLWKVGGTCSDGTIFPSMPEEIEWTVDQSSCQPNMYELRCATADCTPPQRVKVVTSFGTGSGSSVGGSENLARFELVMNQDSSRGRERIAIPSGSDDKTIVARSVWQFERFMFVAEWLWSQAGSPIFSDTGKDNGYYKMHDKARELGKLMATTRMSTDNRYAQKLAELEEKQANFMNSQIGSGSGLVGSGSGQTVGATGNSASGVEYLKLMAEEHLAMAEIDAQKYANFSLYSPLASGENGLGAIQNDPGHFFGPEHVYGDYGEHGGPLYCEAWFPHCWFSTSLCGTRFDKNKVCVIERQRVDFDGVTYMLDPIYPAVVLNPTVNGQGQTISTGVMVGAAVAVGMYNPVAGLAVLAVMAIINYFKGWDIPVKQEDWKNNKTKLADNIFAGFQTYADAILEGGDAAQKAFNTSHTIHNISAMYQRDELKLLLLDLNIPEADFWAKLECIEVSKTKGEPFDTNCKNLVGSDWPLTTPKLHALALKKAAESGVIHTVKYAAAGGSQYPTGGAAYMNNYFGVMVDYLTLYYKRSQEMHTEVSACLTRMATTVGGGLAGGATISGGPTGITTTVSTSVEAIAPGVSTPAPCTGPSCGPAAGADTNTITGIDFGLGGYNPGGFSDGGGSYGSGAWNGGGRFGTGSMGSGGLNDTLMAHRKKRLDARNRLSKGKTKGANDKDSGADRLRRDLAGINGAHAVFKTLKDGIHSSGLGAMTGISAPIDPNAGKGSGSSDGNSANANGANGDGHGGDGEGGDGQNGAGRQGFGGNLFGDSSNGRGGGAYGDAGGTATGLSQYDEDKLLHDSQQGKNEQIDPDADTLFKQVSRAYMHYGVPRLLKKKK